LENLYFKQLGVDLFLPNRLPALKNGHDNQALRDLTFRNVLIAKIMGKC